MKNYSSYDGHINSGDNAITDLTNFQEYYHSEVHDEKMMKFC